MTGRPMTPDEMQNFEEDVLHRRDEEETSAAPASEPEVGPQLNREQDKSSVMPRPD